MGPSIGREPPRSAHGADLAKHSSSVAGWGSLTAGWSGPSRPYHPSLVTQNDDHGTLPAHAERLLARLETLEDLSVHGRTSHMQHMDHARRTRQLADHLRAVLALSDAGRYPSALVVVRTALEHHLMDRLIFLASRYVETYSVRKPDIPKEEARLARLQAGDRPDIARWWWDDSGMNVVIRGFHSAKSKKGRGQTISPYYFRVDDFDPFTGGKKHAARLASPFWQAAHRKDWATEAAAAWRRYFTYEKVRKALDANRLLPRQGVQVDVHYAFLSGFVHPSKRGYEEVYGRNYPDRMRSFDHYATELALLYVITIAAAEIDIFGRMARRRPRLGLSQWAEVEMEVREARFVASHFWFLGVNRRCSTASIRSTRRRVARNHGGALHTWTRLRSGKGPSATTPTRSTGSCASTRAHRRCPPGSSIGRRSSGRTRAEGGRACPRPARSGAARLAMLRGWTTSSSSRHWCRVWLGLSL
jgi:hypothetical protein